MNQETQQLYIDTCKRLVELEGMGKCPWWLYKQTLKKNVEAMRDEKIIQCSVLHIDSALEYNDQISKGELFPYLKIEDGHPWSSSAILARAGIDPRNPLQDIMERFMERWDVKAVEIMTRSCSPMYGVWLKFSSEFLRAKRQGYDELANMLLISMLYEIDRPAYDKGMGPLLEGDNG